MASKWLMFGVVVAVILSWSGARGGITGGSPQVEIWTDKGDASVYRHGEAVEVFVRPTSDCYVIVYEIDTDGYLRVLYPYDCLDDGYMIGGRIYRIGRGGHRRYYVTGPSGVEYIHVVASYSPFRQLYWHGCDGYEDYAYDVTWRGFSDYWGCALPPRIYGDPFIAMQSIDEFICLDALEVGVVWADFTYFYVDERVSYPRYVCYDCHGFHPRLRPYYHVCTGFSITFIDCDPCYRPCSWWWWCSPSRVYCGPRYVCNRRKPCGDYPSQYKWKSRTETVRSTQPVKFKSGDVVDGVRVKAVEGQRDLDLYARGDRGRPPKYKETPEVDTERARVRKAIVDEPTREIRVRETESNERKVHRIESERTKVRRGESEPVKVKSSQSHQATARKVESAISKLREAVTKRIKVRDTEAKQVKQTRTTRTKSSSTNAKRQVAPKVQTKNQGRSPATRRRLSR